MVAMRMSTVGKSSRMVGTQPLATRMTGSFRGHSAAGIMNNSLVNERKSAKVCAASVSWFAAMALLPNRWALYGSHIKYHLNYAGVQGCVGNG
jgi:hypothetical protein